jgi:N-acetyltransferase
VHRAAQIRHNSPVPSPPLDVPPLSGRVVRLEPLAEAHVDDLVRAAADDRETYAFTTVPQEHAGVVAYIGEITVAVETGETIAFAQVRALDDVAVGVTRFLTFRNRPGEHVPYAVEIGGTWLAASAQRTGLNVEAKLLLMEYAFEVWRVGRVDFKTDARNARSRAAIAALGAEFEGVLRNWQPSHAVGEDGLLRDTALYAVVDRDWHEVRARLIERLGVARARSLAVGDDV